MSFDKKIVLITGASRGIGKSIAKAFLKKGAVVVGTATSEKGLDEITKKLEPYGKVHSHRLDFNLPESAKNVFNWMRKETGMPDILVNNAGITKDNLMMRLSEDDWLNVINVNLNSVFYMSKIAVRSMIKKRGGRIINISSVIASSGNIGQTNYAASKAGIIGLSKSLAKEVASRNVTVNMIAPGFIKTDMTDLKLTDDVKSSILKKIPLNRFGSTNDVSSAVLFLASDKANYITGQTLHVNGGLYM